MPAYAVVRKPHMNRVYVTGDTGQIRDLLCDFHARRDEAGYWLPIELEKRLRDAIAAEANYQAGLAAARAAWDLALSVIPADYRTRHGAALGGDIVLDDEAMSEPGLATPSLPWRPLTYRSSRVRDLTGQSLIDGRVQERKTLYSATTRGGRTIYRVSSSTGFGDDQRETYYLPLDLWQRLMASEVRMRGITLEQAQEWLARYRGCVGTELYEFAAAEAPPPTLLPKHEMELA